MSLRRVALLAFAAMCVQNLLVTVMVVFESHFNAIGSGLIEMVYWVAAMTTSVLALGSIFEHGVWHKRSLVIAGAVSAANFVGTFGGVIVGAALTHHRVLM